MSAVEKHVCAGCATNPDCGRPLTKPARGPWPKRCPDCRLEHDLLADREYQRGKHQCPDKGYCRTCRKDNLPPRPAVQAGTPPTSIKAQVHRIKGTLRGDRKAGEAGTDDEASPVTASSRGSGLIDHRGGPLNRHIDASVLDDLDFKQRYPVIARMLERGEELPAQREWREWQACDHDAPPVVEIATKGEHDRLLYRLEPKPSDDWNELKQSQIQENRGRRRIYATFTQRKKAEEARPIEQVNRCDCGWIIVPDTAASCRRCEGPPRYARVEPTLVSHNSPETAAEAVDTADLAGKRLAREARSAAQRKAAAA